MKTIANSILACCCLLLLIGCHKEQQDQTQNETGIIWTEIQSGEIITANCRVYQNEYLFLNSYVYCSARYLDYYLYFETTSDTLYKHELCCTGVGIRDDHSDNALNPLMIPEKVTANFPFVGYDDGYRTITFTVTGIGEEVFKGRSSLISITLPNSIQKIGSYAFADCSLLSSITLPNSLQEIGSNAFAGCSSLTSVTLPSSIQKIHEAAFKGCDLTSCTCYAVEPPTLEYCNFDWELQAIYVPRGSVEAYKYANGWCEFANIIYPIE